MKQIRRHVTYANVMSTIAVFLLIGGGAAFAASKKINGNLIKANSIKTGKLVKEAVKEGKLASNAVTESKIADGAVTTNKLADKAVTEPKIADNAVTAPKIAKNAVNSEKLTDSSVTNTKIAGEAVSTGKLQNSSVTTAKLGAGAVTATKFGTTQPTLVTKSVPANGTLEEILSCPAGGRALSGGYFTSATGVVQVTRFRPNGTTQWAFTFKNNSASASGVDIYVYCLLE